MAQNASKAVAQLRNTLIKLTRKPEPARLRPDPRGKGVLQTLQTHHKVYIHNVPSPEAAVEQFLDKCLDIGAYTIQIAAHEKDYLIITEEIPNEPIVHVTSKAPYRILGWIDPGNLDFDTHYVRNHYRIRQSDPIYRHPKEMLDEYWRG